MQPRHEEGQVDQETPPQSHRSPINSRQAIRIIASATLVFGLLGLLIGSIRANGRSATASVTLAATTPHVFETPGLETDEVDLDSYVDSQVDVLGSLAVFHRAASILEGRPQSPSPDEIGDRTSIARIPDGMEIEITYTAEDDTNAIDGANAVVRGYRELMGQRWSESHSAAIAALEETLATAMAATESLIGEVRPGPEGETDVTQEMQAIIGQLQALDEQVQPGASAGTLQTADVRRQILAIEVDALQSVMTEQMEGSRLSTATARLDAALTREARLSERLIELQVDSRLAGDGVRFATLAETATSSSAGPLLAGVSGLVLGMFVGLGIVYGMRRGSDRIPASRHGQRLVGYPVASDLDPRSGQAQDAASSSAPVEAGGRHR
jgi:hypothetical protein